MRRPRLHLRRGLTLVELVFVVAILAILAAAVIPAASSFINNGKSAAAQATLLRVREAIVGGATGSDGGGYRADTGGKLPNKVADLLTNPFPGTDPLSVFDRDTGLGWRGPYITSGTGTYVLNPARGFTAAYGNAGDLTVLDPWGNPVVLQYPTAGAASDREPYARLVSAGPDGILQTPPDALALDSASVQRPWPATTAAVRGDDLVLFLNRGDAP
jgi:prepilin-type N-terminal cleavage/methylation domain-containing protein